MSFANGWRGTDVIMREHLERTGQLKTNFFTNNNNIMENEIPRRNRLDLNTPAEKAIHEAIQEVEKVGVDSKLTDIVVMLANAKEKLSDYIDGK